MTDPIPDEQVYLDAASAFLKVLQAYRRDLYGSDDAWERDVRRARVSIVTRPGLRAAIESAYRAGYGQGRDDEAAGLDTPQTGATP